MSQEQGTTPVTADEPADAPAADEQVDEAGSRPAPRPATFRAVPTVALVAIGFLALCLSPIAFQGGPWFLLFGVPVAAAVWVIRARTRIDEAGVRVSGLTSARSMPWAQVTGLRLPERGWVRAVPAEGPELDLPGVRIRDLGRVGEASGGRISAPTPAEAEAATEHARELQAARMRVAALREKQAPGQQTGAQPSPTGPPAGDAGAAQGDVRTEGS